MMPQNFPFENSGFCFSCNRQTKFTAHGKWWRDEYKCTHCGSLPRERALMYCIEMNYPDWKELTIHESSPAFRATSLRLKNEGQNYLPSYYFPDKEPGSHHNGYRCENFENLTFADSSIDLHISQDVFEHIMDPAQAFKEVARTLKPGGAHIFSTPLVNKNTPSEARVRLGKDGQIEHLKKPPEYHGDPLSPEGSLVTMHWGYDITDFIFRTSGLSTTIIYIDNLNLGIRAEFIEVLITRK